MTTLHRRAFIAATAAGIATPTALGAKECSTVGMNWITMSFEARNVIAEPGRAGALFGRAWRIEQGPLSRWCPLLPVKGDPSRHSKGLDEGDTWAPPP